MTQKSNNTKKKTPQTKQKQTSPPQGASNGSKKKDSLDSLLAEFAAQDKAKEEQKQKELKTSNSESAPVKPLGPYFLKRTFEQPPSAQTSPEPTVPVDLLYKKGTFPTGKIEEYEQEFNRYRITSAEKKAAEKKFDEDIQDARKAAEVHKQARQWLQSWVKPGMKMIDIAEKTEDKIRELLQSDGLEAGIGFPMGCSLNHCAAHYTPNPGDTTVLGQNDVVKFDIGVHVKGRIVDSAFTMCWNPQFDPLLHAVKEATYAGIKAAGIDVRLNEIGGIIQEVMESHEVEIAGKTHKVKVLRNLCGHSIDRYRIHGKKKVPLYDDGDTTKMEECEFYAIETFGSTGRGLIEDDIPCSHYMRNWENPVVNIKGNYAKNLLNTITKHFGTLAFCHRYLDRLGEKMYQLHLRSLVNAGVINPCPPLVDIKGSYVSQFEHTFALRPTCKEILSIGEDY